MCGLVYERSYGIEVGAAEHAVATDVGVDDAGDADLEQLLDEVRRVDGGGFEPALGGDHAITGVEADDDAISEESDGVEERCLVLDGSCSEDDALNAGVEIAIDGGDVADAAAHLNRYGSGATDR